MSKEVGACPVFQNACKSVAAGVLTAWYTKLSCSYDGSPYSKRDFVLFASHHWGTGQCYWGKDTKEELFRKLREVGATNIIGRVDWNYIDIAFDIKQSTLKRIQQDKDLPVAFVELYVDSFYSKRENRYVEFFEEHPILWRYTLYGIPVGEFHKNEEENASHLLTTGTIDAELIKKSKVDRFFNRDDIMGILVNRIYKGKYNINGKYGIIEKWN